MKKILALLLAVTLTGCGSLTKQESGEGFRQRIRTEKATFSAQITADYIESREKFSVDCAWDPAGRLEFSLTDPEELSGISGFVEAPEDTVFFDDSVLALPLLADGRLSPAAGPYLLMKALAEGRFRSCVREGELLHLTIGESYADDTLETELWLQGETPVAAEISWRGRRNLTMEIPAFSFGADGV